MAAPEVIAALSQNDLEYRYLGIIGATGLSLADRRVQAYGVDEYEYFAGLSGLTPKYEFMLPDHQYAYFKAQSGFTGTLADVARAFWGAW